MPIRLAEMTEAEYRMYITGSKRNYAEELSRANDLTLDEATAQSEATFRRLLPDDRPGAVDQYMFTVFDEDSTRVGSIWFGVRRDGKEPYGYIWDIMLDPAHRGKGLGEQVMRAVEEKVRALGLSQISLNVFGHNLPARKLYERLGYEAIAVSMKKDL
jgi:ribosomal protein S18 acetylase RimI-like enzyme